MIYRKNVEQNRHGHRLNLSEQDVSPKVIYKEHILKVAAEDKSTSDETDKEYEVSACVLYLNLPASCSPFSTYSFT